jgi:hypothetical protein
MKKFSTIQKSIIQSHIDARQNNKFDEIEVSSVSEMRQALIDGYTFEQLLSEIEMRYTSITAILLNHQFRHLSASYKTGLNKGFRVIFKTLNIE